MEIKRCGKCKISKTIDNFAKNKSRKSGIHNECKQCQANYNRIWFLQKNYKLTKIQAINIVDKFKDDVFCAICGKLLQLGKDKYAVDHNHDTGQVRGLLCANCNKGLGHFKEDLYSLTKAIKYLEKYTNAGN